MATTKKPTTTRKSTAPKKPTAPRKPIVAKKATAPKKAAPKKAAPKKAAPKKAAPKKAAPKKAAPKKAAPKKEALSRRSAAAKPQNAKPKVAPPARIKAPRVSMDEILGQIVRVLSVSPQHRHMALGDLLIRVVPPMRLGQCRVLRGDDGLPLAYAAWARVSDAVHALLEKDPSNGQATLNPEDWNSGPHAWLIDLAAPPQVIPQVLAELQKNVFKGEMVRTLMKRPSVQAEGKA